MCLHEVIDTFAEEFVQSPENRARSGITLGLMMDPRPNSPGRGTGTHPEQEPLPRASWER